MTKRSQTLAHPGLRFRWGAPGHPVLGACGGRRLTQPHLTAAAAARPSGSHQRALPSAGNRLKARQLAL